MIVEVEKKWKIFEKQQLKRTRKNRDPLVCASVRTRTIQRP
jgi:hypothetical protein